MNISVHTNVLHFEMICIMEVVLNQFGQSELESILYSYSYRASYELGGTKIFRFYF